MCRLCICSLYCTMKYTIYGIIMVYLWYIGIFMIFKMVYLWYIYGIFMVCGQNMELLRYLANVSRETLETNAPNFSTHIKRVLTISTRID